MIASLFIDISRILFLALVSRIASHRRGKNAAMEVIQRIRDLDMAHDSGDRDRDRDRSSYRAEAGHAFDAVLRQIEWM